MTLVEFLLARITEDELFWDVVEESKQAHPDRVKRYRAECNAKRIVVSDLADACGKNLTTEWGRSARHGLEIAARALALPYADHPDYDPEWSVS